MLPDREGRAAGRDAADAPTAAEDLGLSVYLTRASFQLPRWEAGPAERLGHVPFLLWLVDALRPQRAVQSGMVDGGAFLALAQGLAALGQGGSLLGYAAQGESAAATVPMAIAAECLYPASRIMRVADQGVDPAVRDIDLLHLAGPGALQGWEIWRERLSGSAVVLLSDSEGGGRCVDLWRALSSEKRSISFSHSGWLGMVAMGPAVPAPVRDLLELAQNPASLDEVRCVYARLAASITRACAGRQPGGLGETPSAARQAWQRERERAGYYSAMLSYRTHQVTQLERRLAGRRRMLSALQDGGHRLARSLRRLARWL